jgi:hypothetical protein
MSWKKLKFFKRTKNPTCLVVVLFAFILFLNIPNLFFHLEHNFNNSSNSTLTMLCNIICNVTLTMYFFKGDQANSAAEVAQKGPFTVSLITTKGILLILNGTNKTFTLNTCQYLVSRNLLKRCHERVV